jgi:mannose-6-phosphate isomerase-like protein (cupin superfamily)
MVGDQHKSNSNMQQEPILRAKKCLQFERRNAFYEEDCEMPRTIRNIGFAVLLVVAASAIAIFAPKMILSAGKSQGDATATGKSAQYFIYDVQTSKLPREMTNRLEEARRKGQYSIEATRLVNLNTTRAEGAPYLDFVWFWKGSAQIYGEQEHVHDFDEFIGFIGTKGPENPRDLGGEMEVWLGGEKYLITKSCLIYVPAGLRHCPIKYKRIDTPILFFSGGMATKYSVTPTEFNDDKSDERKYAKYISYDVNPNKVSPDAMKRWEEIHKRTGSTVQSTRLLDLDGIEGSPYVDFVWLWKGSEHGPNHEEHSHDWGEVFGFIGTKGPENPRDLGGEIELWLDGEKNLVTKSCLVWVPPGMKHCPLQFNRIDSPILLFTIGMTRQYTLTPSKPKQ